MLKATESRLRRLTHLVDLDAILVVCFLLCLAISIRFYSLACEWLSIVNHVNESLFILYHPVVPGITSAPVRQRPYRGQAVVMALRF